MVTLAPEQTHLDAVLTAFGGSNAAVYERDDLPSVLPPAYSEVEVTRRGGGNRRKGGPDGRFGLFTITQRTVGRNAKALRAHRDATAAIEGLTLTVGGFVSTPIAFEGADPISPDDGWYVGFRTFTYALFP